MAKISKCLCPNLFIGATAQIRDVCKDDEILVTLKRVSTDSIKLTQVLPGKDCVTHMYGLAVYVKDLLLHRTYLFKRIKAKQIYNDTKLDDEIEGKRTFCVEEKLHDEKFNYKLSDFLLELEGKDFDLKYIQEHGFNTPILFKQKDGLGMRLPDPELFSVNDVKSYVGARRTVEVFDCDTHQADSMSMHHFVRYYTGSERDKILNVTSLEFSHTGLDRIIDCPTVVREDIDWVPSVWPKHKIAEQKDQTNTFENMKYPKVRKYVLMSVAGCYTDFHIDFGGSSVWYHILKGAKVFWLIQPTDANLAIYEEWVLSGRQQDVFFGDLVTKCYKIHLIAGDTFMIPTGWIHGVYTPVDSLVFGGNYLHAFNMPMQLKVHDLEEDTHVPRKLRFPFFVEIHWYLVKAYVDILERDMDERRLEEFENMQQDEGVFKMVQEEVEKTDFKSSKPKWQNVYLTIYEIEGLKEICERFKDWQQALANYPKDLKEDPKDLLERLQEQLQYHEDDDQILACRGINLFRQYDEAVNFENSKTTVVENKETKPLLGTSLLNTPIVKIEPLKSPSLSPAISPNIKSLPLPKLRKDVNVSKLKSSLKSLRKICKPLTPKTALNAKQVNTVKLKPEPAKISKRTVTIKATKHTKPVKKNKKKRKKYQKRVIRRVRCLDCEGCTRDNCDQCKFCLDHPRNGGENRLRQSCALRFCKDPQLPAYVFCLHCDEGRDEGVLMECSVCAEVVHPKCLKKTFPCKISQKVNNLWECPDCCESSDDEATEYSENMVGGIVPINKQKWYDELPRSLKAKGKRKKRNVAGVKRKAKQEPAAENETDSDSPSKKSKSSIKSKDKSSNSKKSVDRGESSDDEPLSNLRPAKHNGVKHEAKVNGHSIQTPASTIKYVEPKRIIRPAPFEPYQACLLVTGGNHKLNRALWIHVFSYLNKRDINRCMLVCKSWNQWCLNQKLWYKIDLSGKTVVQQMLTGIIRRQPKVLDLHNSNVTPRQLEWLLKRLPCLEGLNISLSSASVISSLIRVNCPPIKSLNLAWCDAIHDRFLTQIFKTTCTNGLGLSTVNRLNFLENLNLTGCNIGDEVMDCILNTLTKLKVLNISYCNRITKTGFELITQKKHKSKDLSKIIFHGCSVLSDEFIYNFNNTSDLPDLIVK